MISTYPEYKDGWHVTAESDGTLYDSKGQSYNYLYWESESDIDFDFSTGYCIKGADTATFLEKKLLDLGLTRKEANEFIKKYLEIYPKVKEYGEECIRVARENGYASTLMGRIRHLPDINSSNHVIKSFAERVR